MSKVPASVVRVWLDAFVLDAFLTSVGQDIEQKTPDVTALSDTGPRRIPAGYDHKDSFVGFFDGAQYSVDEVLDALRGSSSDHYVCKLFEGATPGKTAYETVALMSSEPRAARLGEAIGLSLDLTGSNSLSRGVLLLNQTVTSTVNGTGQDQGATTSGTEYQAVFRVFSGTFTSLTVKIQESSDNGGSDPWADIAGLSHTFTAAGVYRVSTTAATERYKRAVVSAFTGTSAMVGATGGIVA